MEMVLQSGSPRGLQLSQRHICSYQRLGEPWSRLHTMCGRADPCNQGSPRPTSLPSVLMKPTQNQHYFITKPLKKKKKSLQNIQENKSPRKTQEKVVSGAATESRNCLTVITTSPHQAWTPSRSTTALSAHRLVRHPPSPPALLTLLLPVVSGRNQRCRPSLWHPTVGPENTVALGTPSAQAVSSLLA